MRYRNSPSGTASWVLGLCCVLSVTLTAASSWADTKARDQDQVTLIAGELFESAQNLREERREAPLPRRTSELLNDHARLPYEVRLIRSEGAHLHGELQPAKGQVEARRICDSLAQLMARARRVFDVIRLVPQVAWGLDAADGTLPRLAPYYAEG